MSAPASHRRAVLQALLVTFLWSTSWVLIKIGLQDIPALTFAGMRYVLAFVCLLPFALRSPQWNRLWVLSRRDWARLIVLGLLFYAVTQGTQFLGLAALPALTVSLLLNFQSIVVALLGITFLNERLTSLQWGALGVYLLGILIYFYPVVLPVDQLGGIMVTLVGVLAGSLSSALGRSVNRTSALSPLLVTVVSMGFGSFILLITGLLTQDWPHLDLTSIAIIAWLAVVNTAFAFTLWNNTLRTLTAVQSSLINSTMLIQIALLAWIFLGERLGIKEGIGMALVAVATLLIQRHRKPAVSQLSGDPVLERDADEQARLRLQHGQRHEN